MKLHFGIANDLNSCNATGIDNIPSSLLKVCAPALAGPVSNLINYVSNYLMHWIDIDNRKEISIIPVKKMTLNLTRQIIHH